MSNYKYSTQMNENCAKAVGISLPVSTKHSVVICQYIRKKNVPAAKKMLEDAIALKKPVPFKKFNDNMGHKPGMASGRFCIKACKQILALLKSAEANAQFKGLSTANLIIKHALAHKGPKAWHYGRKRGMKAKRTHVEIVLEESKHQEKKKKAPSKENEVTKKVNK